MPLSGIHFITFANSTYTNPDRILSQARESNFFNSVTRYSEADITELMSRHRIHFFARRKHGFGRFMWKPFVVLKRLQEVPYGDVVIYTDSGTHIDPSGKSKLDSYLQSMESSDKSLGVFETSSKYKAISFVRRVVVESYFPSFYSEPGVSMNTVYAGLLLARKTPRVEEQMRDWLKLCEQFLPRIDLGSKKNEILEFSGQDADNGMLPLVLAKHNDYVLFSGQEVNLYDPDGFQMKQVLGDLEYSMLNWDELRESPFTLRRDR